MMQLNVPISHRETKYLQVKASSTVVAVQVCTHGTKIFQIVFESWVTNLQISHIFSPVRCIWLTNLQGREKDLLRRKAQRYSWHRLLRYIFQGFMQGRCLAVSRWLCVENDKMRLHAWGETPFLSISKSLLGPVWSLLGKPGSLDHQFSLGVRRARQCEAKAQKVLVLKVPCSQVAGNCRSQPSLGTSGWDHSFSIVGLVGYVVSSLECNICSAILSCFHLVFVWHFKMPNSVFRQQLTPLEVLKIQDMNPGWFFHYRKGSVGFPTNLKKA